MRAKTYRPLYMSQSPIDVFVSPNVHSPVIFSIRVGEEVKVLSEKKAIAHDPLTDRPYKTPIYLVRIEHDGKTGYVNRRWLKPTS